MTILDKIKTIKVSRLELIPGNIVIRQEQSPYHSALYMLTEPYDPNSKMIDVIYVGSLGQDYSGKMYVGFIFNTRKNMNNKCQIRNNDNNFVSFRKLTTFEKDLVKEALPKDIFKRYLDIIKTKTGLKIIV